MKRPLQIKQANKIFACIDQLLMEDADHHPQQKKRQKYNQSESANDSRRQKNKKYTNLHSQSNQQSKCQPLPESNAVKLRRLNTSLAQKSQSDSSNHQINVHQINTLKVKGNKQKSKLNNTRVNSLKMKKSVSYDPNLKLQRIKQAKLEIDFEEYSDHSFLGSHATSPTSLLGTVSRNQNGLSDAIKHSQKKLSAKKEQSKGVSNQSLSQRKKQTFPPLQNANPSNQKESSEQFCLTHNELQFISLLYPDETPSQLMVKLLSYYEQQLQHKNSFEDIFFREQKTKKKVNPDVYKFQQDSVKEQQEEADNSELFVRLPMENGNRDNHEEQNQYTRLKEECLAALGSQMVQTQVKSTLVETANVNYYTRQYAMPHIMEIISEKNQQSQNKLQKLKQANTQFKVRQQSILNKSRPMQTNESLFSNMNLPDQYVHKVYIPANIRGQCFDMDYELRATLFDYVSQNEYHRVLRDMNHLIQKVLLYHRHSSYLKKKNSSLFTGWNLVLVIVLLSMLVLLYVESLSMFQGQSSNIEIVVFFVLSFVLILIMGNAFNNYKKSVKRSSLIKDICQEITNYLEFANCSSKNVKWVLGKDFFWLEVWIYLVKGKNNYF